MHFPFALLDVPGGGAFLFEGLVSTLVVGTADDFARHCRSVEMATGDGQYAVAALNYELGHALEPRAGAVPAGELGYFWLFSQRTLLSADELASYLSDLAGNPPRPATVECFLPEQDASAYAHDVRQILDYIEAGDCYQTNLTFPFSGNCIGDPLALYARLRAAQPVACGGLLVTPECCVLSLSPELFIERRAGRLHSRPMKGTAARHENAAEDAYAVTRLRSSAKERAENVMIVDLIRNDLGRVARPGSVQVDALCAIESYPSVHQMTSSVSAECEQDLASVLTALFPCGSITGAPKIRAMQIIRELERAPRGLYTGALGWIGADGEFSFNVAIRTLQIDAAGRVTYGVGSGIVWDSDPAAEYAECLLKASFVTRADPGFRLIETLRLEAGDYPLLPLHLARLNTSATALAFAYDETAIRQALKELASSNAKGIYRARLTLGRAGDLALTASSLAMTPAGMKVVISPQQILSDDPWLRHKTTVRDVYDGALASLEIRPEIFDGIFFNERGELAEGARSSIFLRKAAGQPLLTPALSCGALPGVLRQSLLLSGQAEEAVLYEADLHEAAELYLGNALRGLIPVTLTVI